MGSLGHDGLASNVLSIISGSLGEASRPPAPVADMGYGTIATFDGSGDALDEQFSYAEYLGSSTSSTQDAPQNAPPNQGYDIPQGTSAVPNTSYNSGLGFFSTSPSTGDTPSTENTPASGSSSNLPHDSNFVPNFDVSGFGTSNINPAQLSHGNARQDLGSGFVPAAEDTHSRIGNTGYGTPTDAGGSGTGAPSQGRTGSTQGRGSSPWSGHLSRGGNRSSQVAHPDRAPLPFSAPRQHPASRAREDQQQQGQAQPENPTGAIRVCPVCWHRPRGPLWAHFNSSPGCRPRRVLEQAGSQPPATQPPAPELSRSYQGISLVLPLPQARIGGSQTAGASASDGSADAPAGAHAIQATHPPSRIAGMGPPPAPAPGTQRAGAQLVHHIARIQQARNQQAGTGPQVAGTQPQVAGQPPAQGPENAPAGARGDIDPAIDLWFTMRSLI